ncbi:MAG: hypothetical protein SLAVMIC_00147 [uncultured marine phage]|uniref:Uncharacterized protein n=1 Tax=uncultured marine phage TaxID=707152 RepID=A0A8D9FQU1_9VIRU|nr:MAG: hypothetical protein SLAVMIC_00147 [uncultured marine phage]
MFKFECKMKIFGSMVGIPSWLAYIIDTTHDIFWNSIYWFKSTINSFGLIIADWTKEEDI